MTDFWGFLIQTLTASGVAAVLLLVKRLLRDKLPPRWQFGIGGILGLSMLVPVGQLGAYVLFDWPRMVETLKTVLTGSFERTRITAPVPLLPDRLPRTAWEWVFAVYLAGVIGLLLWNGLDYLRLRAILRRGQPLAPETDRRLRQVEQEYGLCSCHAVQVPGLPSAFVCGLFRPILALPADRETDPKVLLHELMHLKHRDVFWGIIICVLRCVHWCNPLLWYCADQAGNDLEARCDQRVMELLEGEDRRDYGRILLSMANERYARTPGTSSVSNGGKHIRLRIEAIARFRRYPAGMGLVSVCIAGILVGPMVFGVQSREVPQSAVPATRLRQALVDARLIRCSTPAGAIDTYAKAILTDSGCYRIMCAPEALRTELAEQMMERARQNRTDLWESGIPVRLDPSQEYGVFGLEQKSEDALDAILVCYTADQPETPPDTFQQMELCLQKIHLRRDGRAWVVASADPAELQTMDREELSWGCKGLPSVCYRAETADFRVEVFCQVNEQIDNRVEQPSGSFLFPSSVRRETVPRPDAEFDRASVFEWSRVTYLGDPGKKELYTSLGLSYAPWRDGADRPKLEELRGRPEIFGGSSSNGSCWTAIALEPGWNDIQEPGGGGTTAPVEEVEELFLPGFYAARLYLNGQPVADLILEREANET